jgi:hypothetical protein
MDSLSAVHKDHPDVYRAVRANAAVSAFRTVKGRELLDCSFARGEVREDRTAVIAVDGLALNRHQSMGDPELDRYANKESLTGSVIQTEI